MENKSQKRRMVNSQDGQKIKHSYGGVCYTRCLGGDSGGAVEGNYQSGLLVFLILNKK